MKTIESATQIMYEYNYPFDLCKWISEISQLKDLKIKTICLDNYRDRALADEESTTLNKISNFALLKQICRDRNIDTVAIVGQYQNTFLIVGANLKREKAFISLKKHTNFSLPEMEKTFKLTNI